MSEYQHYQFLAVDRPLTDRQLADIRKLTSRATLTRTTFVNTYQWGDFKGNCDLLMEKYYDAHLYFANWGYRRVVLRWPAGQLPLVVARQYCTGVSAEARRHGAHVLVSLVSDDETGELEDFDDLFGFDDHEDTAHEERWLPSIAEARHDVAAGDMRLLYLARLLCLGNGDPHHDDVEPPIPAGLDALPDSLTDLARFLRIDPGLITAAASRLPPPALRPRPHHGQPLRRRTVRNGNGHPPAHPFTRGRAHMNGVRTTPRHSPRSGGASSGRMPPLSATRRGRPVGFTRRQQS
ncbi:hypothetical protein ACFU3O_14465 [Streptomyces antibioticus]|uniref:hypothetical protein n=1 Tax=Streptomyces antibioticus TaxID=1890 RepID=UPI0036C30316